MSGMSDKYRQVDGYIGQILANSLNIADAIKTLQSHGDEREAALIAEAKARIEVARHQIGVLAEVFGRMQSKTFE